MIPASAPADRRSPAAFALALLTPMGPVLMFAIVKTTDFAKWYIAWLWLKKERWVHNLAKPVPVAD